MITGHEVKRLPKLNSMHETKSEAKCGSSFTNSPLLRSISQNGVASGLILLISTSIRQ
jgi:hypothetical protein